MAGCSNLRFQPSCQIKLIPLEIHSTTAFVCSNLDNPSRPLGHAPIYQKSCLVEYPKNIPFSVKR